jgi:hypothetical protein
VEGADYRGEDGNAGEMITTGGDEGKQPKFEEGQTSCWPWWPAQCPANRDASADLRRREAAHHARLSVLDLLAALVSSGCAPTTSTAANRAAAGDELGGPVSRMAVALWRETVGRRQR